MKKTLVILTHAVIGWVVCGAVMGVGRQLTTLGVTLVVHAVAAPLVFGGLSWHYHRRFCYTPPLLTAAIFTGFVVLVDAVLVAPVLEKSYLMFTSLAGTWLPLALIFGSAALVGRWVIRGKDPADDSVKARFGRYADRYVTSKGHAQGDELNRLVEIAAPEKSWNMLDVATGAGHTALKFAPYVDHVVALDITPEMLDRAGRLAMDRGLANISTKQAPAEHLPFEPACFDLVTCRIAPHHFEDCAGFVFQAARVLVKGGLLLVQDHLLPKDPVAQAEIEGFERMRDPSHNKAFTQAQWRGMFVSAGLTVVIEETILKRHSFGQWAERQGCSPDVIARLEDHVDRASQAARQWLDPNDWQTSTASFVNHHLIIAGRKG